MTTVSIVVPVYYNEESLPESVPRLLELARSLDKLEILFVDDGSGDRSFEILRAFRDANPAIIRIIKLTRNFGSMGAIQAGLAHAQGQCVGVISADLQDPPELFIEMASHWKAGIPAIYAARNDRRDSVPSRFFSATFYSLFRRFAIPGYPAGGFDFFLIDRQIVNDIIRIAEPHANLPALVYWLGYPSLTIPYTRQARAKGKSRWTLSKKVKFMIDSFIAFSFAPIRIMSMLGMAYACIALCYAIFVLISRFFWKAPVEGWTSLMLVLLFTASFLFLVLAVLGEYIWRISDTVKKRPNYVIEQTINEDNQESPEQQ